MSNFAFLHPEWPALHVEAQRAEAATLGDPRTACFYARRTLELAVAWLFQVEGGRQGALRVPYKPDLAAFLSEPSFQQLVGPVVHTKMDVIRKLGNDAAHSTRPVASRDAQAAVRELFHVAFWLARRYARRVVDRPDPALAFRPELLPPPAADLAGRARAETQAAQSAAQAALQQLADALAAKDAAERDAQARSATHAAEVAALRAEIDAARAANAGRPDAAPPHDYDEAATRDLFIDLLLREAGWPLAEKRDREFPVTGLSPEAGGSGHGFVDYVLWGDDGRPLGLVEAKRTRRSAHDGREQARRYADALEARFGCRPVIYLTNGYEHSLWDDTLDAPRSVQGFHKKDELQLMLQRRGSRKALAGMTIDARIADRHYQQRAIRRIGEAFERDRQRRALVVMATGAGKTRTVVALVDLLMRANWVKRVLFLADRVALVNQAVNVFKAMLPDASAVNLVTDRSTDGRVCVATYPTLMGLIDQRAGAAGSAGTEARFGVGHFDLIVVDEAHRSVYQKYRAIFSHFDALLVGLTATPKDEIDRNTYGLFGLENGVPTDAYPLADAIAEGHLVPPKTVSVPLKFQRQGIRYNDLGEADREQWDALDWAENDGDAPEEVSAEAVNRWLFNRDTVDKVLQTLMTHGRKVAGGDRLGKTIVFAKNERHAQFIAERFDAHYPAYRGLFARVVTHQTEGAQGLIDDFSVKDKPPHLAISVDMLDTGIDVPEVVNLVLFKPVRSKTKFWQMLGRGTRRSPDLYGPGDDKQDFLVFDFCQNLEFFSQELEGSDGAVAEPLGQRLFRARLALIGAIDRQQAGDGRRVAQRLPESDLVLTDARIRADTAEGLRQQVAGMSLANFVVRPKRRWVEHWALAAAWQAPADEALEEAADQLSGLPSAVRDDDEPAKRFDLLLLHTQLAALGAEPGWARLQRQVRDLAEALLDLQGIPAVRAHLPLIDAMTGDDWWEGVTLPMLEQARRKLRALIRLLPTGPRRIIYTDFEDEIGPAADLPLRLPGGAVDFERFRLKARAFLRAHTDRLALQKLRRNQPLTAVDLDELGRLLQEAGGSGADIEHARLRHANLPAFVRSLVGLDREAAKQAFSHLLAGSTATAHQIQFIDEVIDHLTEHGAMPASRLYESPFTDIDARGPDGVFAPADVEHLFTALDGLALKTA